MQRSDGDDPRHQGALEDAQELLDAVPELELTSALKQAAADRGISYGEEMKAFIKWAYQRLGI